MKQNKSIYILILFCALFLYFNSQHNFNNSSEISSINPDLPPTILLWTSWRSGSNYLGVLLRDSTENTFYSCEPLAVATDEIYYANDSRLPELMDFFKHLLHADLEDRHMDFFSKFAKFSGFTIFNTYYTKSCKSLNLSVEKCGRQKDTVNSMIKKSELHSLKIIRLPLKLAESILEDPTLNLKIMYLIRDPRASFFSREEDTLECTHETCINPKKFCALFEDNLLYAKYFEEKYPNKFKTVQYDKILKDNATINFKELLKFLNLSFTQKHQTLLNPLVVNNGQYDDNKVPESHVEKWRKVRSIQEDCKKVIDMLGLRLYKSENDFKNLMLPNLL